LTRYGLGLARRPLSDVGSRPMTRERVCLSLSVRAAARAGWEAHGGDEVVPGKRFALGFWWWIVGVPTDKPDAARSLPAS
jgi:hypothetical protein